jgi:glutamate formiminotransferase/formiminotetrahydrofolate cyclodeaminase
VTETTSFRDLTVADFVHKLASGEPVPGGGSAAAIAASLGGALVAMVASLSEGRPKYAEHAALHTEAIAAGNALADRFLALADEDAEAYAGYGYAMKMPRDTDEQREARIAKIREAAHRSSLAPFRTVQACLEMVAMAEALAGRSNKNASSDLEVASLMAVAASQAAAANVYVNLPSIGDEALARDLLARTEALVDEIDRAAAQTRQQVRSGESRDPLPAQTA